MRFLRLFALASVAFSPFTAQAFFVAKSAPPVLLPDAVAGSYYAQRIGLMPSPPCPCAYAFSAVAAATGLAITADPQSVTIQGMPAPAAPGAVPITFTVTATGADGSQISSPFSIKVGGPPPTALADPAGVTNPAKPGLSASPVALRDAYVGHPYSQSLAIQPSGAACIPSVGPGATAALAAAGVAFAAPIPPLQLTAAAVTLPPPGASPVVFQVSCPSAAGAGTTADAFFSLNVLNPATMPVAVYQGSPTAPPGPVIPLNAKHQYDGLCDYTFNDCDWVWSAIGGAEQSDLSSQNSQTDPFVDLFIRGPWNIRLGSAWLRARFLGAPNNSGTQNVLSVATNPSGAVSSNSLSTVGYAVDYMIGYEFDMFQPNRNNPTRGMFTLGLIAGFGATTPLSSQTAAVAYVVPDYGTNECNQLQQRFGAGNGNGYNPVLPGSGSIPTTGSNPVTTYYCALQQPLPVGTSLAPPQPIKYIAFSPQDRSSFLLKYEAGVRLVNRWLTGDRCSNLTHCTRSMVDFTLGQDQSITGGYLRRFVFKTDAIFPIPKSGIYFFASTSNRIEHNKDLSPLILTQATIAAAGSTGGITIPSSKVFVLPLKQTNRDFYRVGLGLDLSAILPKLFSPLSSNQ